MIRCVAFASWLGLATFSAAALDLPSGQPVELWEVLVDEVGVETWIRFRFLAPQIGDGDGFVDFETVVSDFEVLCSEIALPYLQDYQLSGDVIVISLLDRQVEFGYADPDATQYIDAFRPENGACIWEAL